MSAIKEKQALIEQCASDIGRIFHVAVISDVAEDDWIKLLTYCAICVELMKSATPSKLREAARNVEIRHYLKGQ